MSTLKNLHEEEQRRSRALLVGVYMGSSRLRMCEEHLDELEFLAETYGVDTVKRIAVPLRKFEAGTFVTKGKLEELQGLVKTHQADLVIFDDEITPAQQRNLEAAFEVTVMDRTELILEVFAQRAQTKEAKLQIELARVKYQFPRLKRLWTHLSRQRMSGGFLKGEGEKQLEIDKQLLQKNIDKLQKELDEVKQQRALQRQARGRSEVPTFAIVGYTNAGKSTLLNALTEAEVFVEDKLFATLDTTTRRFLLPNNQDILLIDTVGFIRKLPHQLVAAFKSTLEEAIQADILLHLIDVNHPLAEEQADVTMEVLKELNAGDRPIITLLNKIDLLDDRSSANRFRIKYPHTVLISAKEKIGFEELFDVMVEELNKRRKVIDFRVPQSDYAVVSELSRIGNIIKQDYEENDVLMRVDLPNSTVGRFESYIVEPDE